MPTPRRMNACAHKEAQAKSGLVPAQGTEPYPVGRRRCFSKGWGLQQGVEVRRWILSSAPCVRACPRTRIFFPSFHFLLRRLRPLIAMPLAHRPPTRHASQGTLTSSGPKIWLADTSRGTSLQRIPVRVVPLLREPRIAVTPQSALLIVRPG